MKRFTPLLLAAVVALSCTRDQSPPTSPLTGSPRADISDGANGGNEHFYWLPELVESPTFSGTFHPDLPATINLCQLDGNGPSPACVSGSETVLFEPAQVAVSLENEQYSAVWHTRDSDLTSGAFYRLSVSVGSRVLGHRDLNPLENPPSPIDKSAPFYAFNNGNTVNLKFRIEDGVLCEGDGPCGECYLQTTGDGGNNPDFFPTDPDVRACNADAGLGVRIPDGVLPEATVVVVERVACPETADGRVNFFPYLDSPQYEGCFEARTEPELTQPIEFATIAVCVDASSLSHAQQDRLQLAQTADRNDPTADIRILNNVAADFVDCEAYVAANTPPLLRFARRTWEKVSPFAAKNLYATHRGEAGEAPGFSDFVWTLPSQQEILEGNGQIARVGTAVATPPAVLVTDEAGDPVSGARITFTVTEARNGGLVVADVPTVTGSDGIARVTSWTLGNDVGINVLASSGLGIGVKDAMWTQADGRQGVGPFAHSAQTFVPSGPTDPADLDRYPLTVQEPSLEFTAFGCDAGQGTADVTDGVKDASWDCANTAPFIANTGGGKKDGTFYWMRDGSTFYFAIEFPVDETASEKDNIFTLYLTDGANASLTEGDDVLVLDGATQAFSDQNLAAGKCPKGQSFCAFLDDEGKRNGEGYFLINVNPDGSAFYFYELKHEFKGPAFQDIADTGILGAAFSLRVGKGTKGNTEWPGPALGDYEQIIP
jgi:hypothetical protein